jgi:hypothetical protein
MNLLKRGWLQRNVRPATKNEQGRLSVQEKERKRSPSALYIRRNISRRFQ